MNKFNHIFGQILDLFPRSEFFSLVRQTKAHYGAKGFSCWDQFVAMLFCQLGHADSLREICYGLATGLGKVRHLGLKKAPSRSTLAYANEHRPWQLYQGLFYQLLERCRSGVASKHKFRFKNRLLSFDATLIELCVSIFDWAKYRQTKGAIKLHLLLDHAGYLPQYLCMTEGKAHEVTIARKLKLEPGTILVIDRGFFDFDLFDKWIRSKIWFVTRMKANTTFDVISERPVPKGKHILSDKIIKIGDRISRKKCPHELRLVQLWDEEKQECFFFLTNNMKLASSTIAGIYKDRWQIEVFFKTLKQNLRIKTFVGTSANAVLTQIWTALISILVLKYLKAKSTINWSLSNLVAMLRFHLLSYKDLWVWINDPYYLPPQPPMVTQLNLFP